MRARLSLLALLLIVGTAHAAYERARTNEREHMVEEQLISRDITDEATLAAMRTVPRHRFVPEDVRRSAYDDNPLPIGHGQTISQPYIVAYMTQAARLKRDSRVLEIGTGSGYQAAVLAELCDEVYSIEIVEPLAHQAAATLKETGYERVHLRIGDGYNGWPEAAPFDAILVTAGAEDVPPKLFEQLKEGGRLVIPVGPAHSTQFLKLVTKRNGKPHLHTLMPVRFVPFTREKP
ncbi:protein-L-isoaspartate(D-aspartate) O-methyltransferase [Opitutus terrae]|uniref:Protein-L-isoaspartate O-methyltransferase n=1 Tax=Opitutus terrae (strain DSM 11246 / JCM 15787 / PB90-1) TaxID=452637 RepID=PIMT_OPITP|nr:protein-L-isoaspartate(D-aspartate) O-methyltransferase [Opitutus terrae]B1ZPF0.1 RecName: Full=Protein-L-isoaspartate O-methyltransferase; AltName: Full=L-isoaspartyl protein carboxyl methyltransferase; AltName: Full=Protein L-isoaspartyl methyltransferase; AltName: Full=Protein-beta-aspartate methyltransferase; Short=PIMT [Opitutus terrae PB90-1]ACB73555.1 protein-L-isoaspartate O-methyltransferase [Opitutus terrae PB90-1]